MLHGTQGPVIRAVGEDDRDPINAWAQDPEARNVTSGYRADGASSR